MRNSPRQSLRQSLRQSPRHKLSQLDAFFVAYQESAGISMQLGIEVELDEPADLEAARNAIRELTQRWPRLGQRLAKGPLGLSWSGAPDPSAMLSVDDDLERWRNEPIDPFEQPPFQLLLSGRLLAFRAHHAVCDGESFAALCGIAVAAVTGAVRPDGRAARETDPSPFSLSSAQTRKKLPAMVRYARWLMRESKADSSMRLALDSLEAGSIDLTETRIDRASIEDKAREAGVSPALYVCGGWMKAIGEHGRARGSRDQRRVSIEMPVSARQREISVGNFISPLLLFGDSKETTPEIARSLRRQFRRAIADRAHLAVPTLTAPSRYLPWWLFRRVGAGTAFSGFATSHFGWLDGATDIREAVSASSTYQVANLRVYTPVCLHMGAALSVIPWPGELQLTLTFRRNAIKPDEASTLLRTITEVL